MKRLLSLFFLTVYLFSTTEVSQLLRFPILIDHYFEHKENNPEISVLDFFILHYDNHLENHPQNEDFDQDQSLPFIAHNNVLSFCFVFPTSICFEIKTKTYTSLKPKILPADDLFSDNKFLSSIWQPPRFC